MNSKLVPIIFLSFINVIGFSLLIPILPFIVEQYGGNSITYGVLLCAFPLFQFFGTPILGTLSDKYGRRPMLLISMAGTVIGWIIFTLAFFVPTIPILGIPLPFIVLFLARAIDGITGGNNSIAMAYVSDITPPHEKTKVFGALGGVFGVGFMIGPAIGGLTSSLGFGFVGTAVFALLGSLVTLAFLYFFLPESLHHQHRAKDMTIKVLHEINIFYKLRRYRENNMVLRLLGMKSAFLFTFTSYTSIIVLFMKDRFSLTPQTLGLLFLLIGLFLIVNQTVVARLLSKRVGDWRTFLIGQCILILGLPFLVPDLSFPLFLIVIYVNNVGIAVVLPTSRALITNSVDRTKQGEITGIDESILAATSAISPLFAGFLYAHIDAWSFVVFSMILAISLGIFVFRSPERRARLLNLVSNT